MNRDNNVELIDFEVQIPNFEGDGIAEVRTIKVPARKSKGGEWILTNEALDLIEYTQARFMGLMTPKEIKDLRLRIQFTQRQMSELIQAGEKSYTRWETGKGRLSRLVNIVLCSIRDGFLPVTYLQTLYKDGSDWYKKVKDYEQTLEHPIYKITAVLPDSKSLAAASQNLIPGENLGGVWRGSCASSLLMSVPG